MGVVWRAEHVDTAVPAAVKTLGAPDERRAAAIRREIAALAAIDHPGIVRVLDHGVADGMPWIAMELVAGPTLREACPVAAVTGSTMGASADTLLFDDLGADLDAPAPLLRAAVAPGSLLPRLTIARRLCAPLAYLHGEGLVHRDLKPDNVIVRADGTPVLVDFGLAVAIGEGRDALAGETVRAGTMAYMAPEQIAGEAVDARADLYALGCVLFELVVGRPPYQGNVAAVARAHLGGEPPRPSDLMDGVPAALEAVILQLLSRDPRERPGTADAVAGVLARLGAEPDVVTMPMARPWLFRPRFSGRGPALKAVASAMQRPGVHLVVGESGAGKTRLVLEAAGKARRAGTEVLHGECLPDAAIPYGGLARPLQWLADLCRARRPEEVRALLGDGGPVLAAVEPAFAAIPGAEGPLAPLGGLDARLRLWTVTAEALRAACDRHLVLVLDDLQWADDLTLGFVDLALRSPGDLTLVATVRAEEIGDRLQPLVAGASVTRLGPLDDAAVAGMARDMLGLEALPDAFVAWLARLVEGNPFFVAEALRTALGEDVLRRDREGRWTVARGYDDLALPRSVRETVARRLAGLGEAARAVAEAAAVLGRRVDLDRLAEALGRDPADAVPELMRQHVWADDDDGLRFAHDKLREVLLDGLSADRRVRLHAAAARILEASPERDTRMAEIAEHHLAAGASERARDLFLAAGLRSAQRYGVGDAIRWLEAGLAIPGAPPEEVARAGIEYGRALVRAGRSAEGLAELDRAWAAASDAIRLEMTPDYAHVLWNVGRSDDAERLALDAAAAAADRGARRAEGAARAVLAYIAVERGQVARAIAEIDLALPLVESDDETMRLLLMARANADTSGGRLKQAVASFERLLAMERASGNRRGEVVALVNLSIALYDLDRLPEAVALYDRILALARTVGDKRLEGGALCNQAVGLAELGFPLEALELHDRAAALSAATEDVRFGAFNDLYRARLLRWLGRLDDARAWLTRAQEAAARIGDDNVGSIGACERGHHALIAGEPANTWLLRARTGVDQISPKDIRGRALARLEGALAAASRGEELLCGERREDVPEPIRSWLAAR